MQAFRALFLSHRRLAALLVAVALCMKALVPTGYMLAAESKVLTIQICADALGQHLTRQIAVPMKKHAAPSTKADTCPYAALGHAMLGGADPVQLALALLFAVMLGFAPMVAPAMGPALRLRPPLRGPPLLI